ADAFGVGRLAAPPHDRRAAGARSLAEGRRDREGARGERAAGQHRNGALTMAQLVGLIISEDDAFKKHFGRVLRAGAIPVSIVEDRTGQGSAPDLIIVDTRGDAASA